MTEWENAVIERIKKSMKTRGITQQNLAEAIGAKQYTVSRMLIGSPFPGLEKLKKIADAIDVSLYYLLGVRDESYRELSPEAAKIADAYQSADPMIKTVVERILLG